MNRTYNIHLINQYWLIEATIEEKSAIEALKKWYLHLNIQAGNFKNFQYEAKEVLSGCNYIGFKNGKIVINTMI